MSIEDIRHGLREMAAAKVVEKMPRGLLDTLAPDIFAASERGHSLHDIRRLLELRYGMKTSVPAISKCLRRNKLVKAGPNPNSHNV